MTFLVSSHVMDEAERCDKLLLMREGEILAARAPDGPAPAHRRARSRRGVPGAGRGDGHHEPRAITLGDHAAGADASSAATRAPSRFCSSCPACLVVLLKYVFAGQPGVFDRIGGPAARALPVHRDVRRHVDHDAARADVGNARAADDDAARRSSISCSAMAVAFALLRRAPGGSRLRGRLRRASASTSPARSWAVGALAVVERACSACRSACSRARSRERSSRPSSSCRRFVFPQLLLCGLFVPRDEMARALELALLRDATDLRLRRDRPGHALGNVRRRLRARRRGDARHNRARARARRADAAPPHAVAPRAQRVASLNRWHR